MQKKLHKSSRNSSFKLGCGVFEHEGFLTLLPIPTSYGTSSLPIPRLEVGLSRWGSCDLPWLPTPASSCDLILKNIYLYKVGSGGHATYSHLLDSMFYR